VTKAAKIWIGFALVSVATPIVYKVAYAIPGYLTVLLALAIVAVTLAVAGLRSVGAQAWSISLTVLGLVLGQWWLIKSILVLASMKLNGFAP
jgi:hypothetical protein